VTGDETKVRPAADVEITLFRIAQEALTNVAKHAKATNVELRLEHSGTQWVMTVRDDGIGFNAAEGTARKDRQSLGMVTMRERAQAVGGEFVVRSAPGRGTIIEIAVPS
jgi:signal transduction histidine kinase